MSTAIEWRGLNPFTIHRREELYIRTGDSSIEDEAFERSKNLLNWEFDISIVSFRPQDYLKRYGPGDFHFKAASKIDGSLYTGTGTPPLDEYYLCLRSDLNGMCRLSVDPVGSDYFFQNIAISQMYELQLNQSIYGPGTFYLRCGNRQVEEVDGPYPWRACQPHRVMPNETIEFEYHNSGLSDPAPRCEIDDIRIYNFKQIVCDFRNYEPPVASSTPKKIDILRGYSASQTTSMIGSKISTTLTFYSAADHTDFVTGADKIHVIFDDKGIPYRGTLELGKCKRIGIDLYEQEITFNAPNKLGMGWL